MIRDGLTGLLDYQSFQNIFEIELSEAESYRLPLSLLLIDIDNFKNVNVNYGYLAGDEVLKIVAQKLIKSLRKSDIVTRYGGEKFVVVLPKAKRDGAVAVAERLRGSICDLGIEYEGRQISVTISIGVSCLAGSYHGSMVELFKRAEEALHEAKNTGKNRCCVSKVGEEVLRNAGHEIWRSVPDEIEKGQKKEK